VKNNDLFLGFVFLGLASSYFYGPSGSHPFGGVLAVVYYVCGIVCLVYSLLYFAQGMKGKR